MGQFEDTQLRRLDLTLLLVFQAAIEGGQFAAASRRLGLTPSAISHAVSRLRDIFDDPLFVRMPRGVQPTPRALALRAPVGEALRLLGGAIRPTRFDPLGEARVFRIAALDYETALFAPLLGGDGAGATRFVFRPLARRAAIEAIEIGEVDLLLGYAFDRGRSCDAAVLFEEEYRVVGRGGHPALARRLDLTSYAACAHVLVSPGGTLAGVVDAALAERGLSRRVALAVPYFLAALATVARTDLLATVPRRVAEAHAAGFGLLVVPPPLPLRRFPVHMVWNRRFAADPGLLWLQARVRDAAEAVRPSPPASIPARPASSGRRSRRKP